MFSLYNAIGKGLNILGSFDLITPLWGILQGLYYRTHYGPGYTFLIRWDLLDGVSANDVKRLLERHGVKTWGLLVHLNTMMISVPKRQAAWASYLLRRHNIPVENPITNTTSSAKKNRRRTGRNLPRTPRPAGWLDRLNAFVDKLDALLS